MVEQLATIFRALHFISNTGKASYYILLVFQQISFEWLVNDKLHGRELSIWTNVSLWETRKDTETIIETRLCPYRRMIKVWYWASLNIDQNLVTYASYCRYSHESRGKVWFAARGMDCHREWLWVLWTKLNSGPSSEKIRVFLSFFLSLLPSYSLKLELQSLAWPHSALSGINKMNLILSCGPKSISQKPTKNTEAMTPTQFYRDTRSSPQWLWVTHGHTKIWTVLMWRLKMWF